MPEIAKLWLYLDTEAGLRSTEFPFLDKETLGQWFERDSVQAWLVAQGASNMKPDMLVSQKRLGIYGKSRHLETVLHPGDRIEIYRPLLCDPKEMRRQRARKK
ncbi:RnfH family protein [Parvibium lacunae]|uniref:RnfH family protein n=1 Tax=Parvibium lacunae TaxID=1888893 RepID=A0A368L7R6_9BURK|nr:RnfH family protein [Parvibium lacunae]RCS59654.1 RnfH family protein [Parvibium lacunae]